MNNALIRTYKCGLITGISFLNFFGRSFLDLSFGRDIASITVGITVSEDGLLLDFGIPTFWVFVRVFASRTEEPSEHFVETYR